VKIVLEWICFWFSKIKYFPFRKKPFWDCQKVKTLRSKCWSLKLVLQVLLEVCSQYKFLQCPTQQSTLNYWCLFQRLQDNFHLVKKRHISKLTFHTIWLRCIFQNHIPRFKSLGFYPLNLKQCSFHLESHRNKRLLLNVQRRIIVYLQELKDPYLQVFLQL